MWNNNYPMQTMTPDMTRAFVDGKPVPAHFEQRRDVRWHWLPRWTARFERLYYRGDRYVVVVLDSAPVQGAQVVVSVEQE